MKIERTIEEMMAEYERVMKVGRALEEKYLEHPTVELERQADQLEKGWDGYLSNMTLAAPSRTDAVAAMESAPHASTNKLPTTQAHPRKRLSE